MDVSDIIARARRLTHTNANNYVEADAVEDLNLVYQELVDVIVTEVDEDYFWDIVNTDSVVGQSEYEIEKIGIAPNELDIKKVNKVYIKYDANVTLLTRARFLNPSNLEFVEEHYETNQPTSDPFFFFKDKSVFIYPAPSAVITDAIRLNLIHVPAVLTAASLEAAIEIPVQFHKVISLGMRPMIFKGQDKTNDAIAATNEFEFEKQKMITFIKDRYNLPGESVTPTLTNLE